MKPSSEAATQSRLRHSWRAALVTLALVLKPWVGATVAQAGISVALQPAVQSVSPGSEFDIVIGVTESGSAFNAFDAIVGYNPAALTFLRLTPLSLQEGALMTSACGNRFHDFREGVDRVTVTEVLLCNGVSVTGPGPIYRLHFRASSTPQTTTVQFLAGPRFYNAGLFVTPVVSSNASVVIGTPVSVEDDVASSTGLRVRAGPNPTRASTTLHVESDRAGAQQILIHDTLGRVVRHLQSGFFVARVRTVSWDGRSDAGTRLPAGVYSIQLRVSGRMARTRLTLLE